MKKELILILASILFFTLITILPYVESAPKLGGVRGWYDAGKCGNGHEVYDCRNCEGRGVKEREPPIQQPTPQPAQMTLPQADSRWISVAGYSSSFNQCKNLCSAYQQSNCGISAAYAYCSAVVSVDLNKNGKIDSGEIGTTPSDTKNCETNVRCYDVIPNCQCGLQTLNIGSCVNLLYQTYAQQGYSIGQALSTVAQQTSANCSPPGV